MSETESNSEGIRLLHGRSGVREALRDTSELALFRYRLNKPAFLITLVVGGLLLALGGMIWWNGDLSGAGGIVGFGVLMAAGLGLGALAAWWYGYTQTHFLAATPDRLFVGKRDRMWSISWELLDREALGFEDMAVSSVSSHLDVEVAGQEIILRLFNPFVSLEDLEGFMFHVLQKLKEQEEETADAPDGG